MLTRLCSFSLAPRASLPAGLEQWPRRLPAANRRSASARTAILSASPGGFRASWKIRNMKGGAETQLSIHTTPCCFPGTNTSHPRGNPPGAASAPGTHKLSSKTCEGQLYRVLPHTAEAAANTRLWFSASCEAAGLCWQHCQLLVHFWPPKPARGCLIQLSPLRTVSRREGKLPFSRQNLYLASSCLNPPGNGPGCSRDRSSTAPTPAALPELHVQHFKSQTAATTGMDCGLCSIQF